jgi:hypothetical protein
MHNLAKLLTDNVNGATFITINTDTVPKLSGGKNNPFLGRVHKTNEGSNVMVFQNKNTNGYANMVARRLAAEGKDPNSFVLGDRKWGVRIPNTPFIEHNGQFYLEVIFLSNGKTTYLVDGMPTHPSHIEGLTTDHEEGRQGGLDNKVVIRTFRVDNITSITVNKNTYTNLYFQL